MIYNCFTYFGCLFNLTIRIKIMLLKKYVKNVRFKHIKHDLLYIFDNTW